MNRSKIILSHLKKEGIGLEIGPCHSPIAPKSEGFDVEILDYTDEVTLRGKYTDLECESVNKKATQGFISTISKSGVKFDVDAIEKVDYIWKGEGFSEITGKENYYDWVIASHVIEHTPDLITFLNSIEDILKSNGVLSLAIPDKRFCFDYFRPLTGLGQVVDSHFEEKDIHSPGQVAEHYMYACNKGGRTGWNHLHQGEFKLQHSFSVAKKLMDHVRSSTEYHDIHSWCFTPASFRLMVHDLNQLGMTRLKEVGFESGMGHEFYISLSKKGMGYTGKRIELLKEIQREIGFTGYSGLSFVAFKLKKNLLRLRRLPNKISNKIKPRT